MIEFLFARKGGFFRYQNFDSMDPILNFDYANGKSSSTCLGEAKNKKDFSSNNNLVVD